jgi:tetratricopeptide (TPR) repeat protein
VVLFHPFFILLLPIAHTAKGDYSFTPTNLAAYESFLQMKLDKGNQLIQQALQEDPRNGISIYLANYEDAIRIFLSEDEKLYKALQKNESIRIAQLQSLDKKSPYYRFAQAEIKLHWAFVKLKMGDEFNAMLGLRSAYKLLVENTQLYPDFVPNMKTMGLLNVLIGSIPSNYNWVLSLIGMEGNIDKGIAQLQAVCQDHDSPFRLEASIIKVVVENYIVHASNGRILEAARLFQHNKDIIIIAYLYSAILTKNGRGPEALSVIAQRPANAELAYFPHVDLLLGELYLFKGDYSSSRQHYLHFLNHFKGKNSLKDTYFKLFLTYWLNNEDQAAMPYLTKVLSVGRELYDSDKYAQRIAKNKEIPNKVLTKIRLATDGGYFDAAFALMKDLSVNQFALKRDKLEYFYRCARLFHKTGQLSEAVDYYLKTIEWSKNETYYFAPNAALQLGYIFQQRNDKEKARYYYNLALSYKNHEYKNSIDNKAKAGLNELKN